MTAPVYPPPVTFDPLDIEGTTARALVSIANSLRILANQTEAISPIVEAGFIISEGPMVCETQSNEEMS